MPIAKTTDNMPLTGVEVSTLQYLEARIHDLSVRIDAQFAAADLRYAQRFDASQQALHAALLAADRAIQAALLSQKEAVAKAEMSVDKRLESMNEFRKTLSDQATSFIPRTEATARFDGLAEKWETLSSRIDRSEGSGQGLSRGWGLLLGAIGLAGTVVTMVVVIAK